MGNTHMKFYKIESSSDNDNNNCGTESAGSFLRKDVWRSSGITGTSTSINTSGCTHLRTCNTIGYRPISEVLRHTAPGANMSFLRCSCRDYMTDYRHVPFSSHPMNTARGYPNCDTHKSVIDPCTPECPSDQPQVLNISTKPGPCDLPTSTNDAGPVPQNALDENINVIPDSNEQRERPNTNTNKSTSPVRQQQEKPRVSRTNVADTQAPSVSKASSPANENVIASPNPITVKELASSQNPRNSPNIGEPQPQAAKVPVVNVNRLEVSENPTDLLKGTERVDKASINSGTTSDSKNVNGISDPGKPSSQKIDSAPTLSPKTSLPGRKVQYDLPDEHDIPLIKNATAFSDIEEPRASKKPSILKNSTNNISGRPIDDIPSVSKASSPAKENVSASPNPITVNEIASSQNPRNSPNIVEPQPQAAKVPVANFDRLQVSETPTDLLKVTERVDEASINSETTSDVKNINVISDPGKPSSQKIDSAPILSPEKSVPGRKVQNDIPDEYDIDDIPSVQKTTDFSDIEEPRASKKPSILKNSTNISGRPIDSKIDDIPSVSKASSPAKEKVIASPNPNIVEPQPQAAKVPAANVDRLQVSENPTDLLKGTETVDEASINSETTSDPGKPSSQKTDSAPILSPEKSVPGRKVQNDIADEYDIGDSDDIPHIQKMTDFSDIEEPRASKKPSISKNSTNNISGRPIDSKIDDVPSTPENQTGLPNANNPQDTKRPSLSNTESHPIGNKNPGTTPTTKPFHKAPGKPFILKNSTNNISGRPIDSKIDDVPSTPKHQTGLPNPKDPQNTKRPSFSNTESHPIGNKNPGTTPTTKPFHKAPGKPSILKNSTNNISGRPIDDVPSTPKHQTGLPNAKDSQNTKHPSLSNTESHPIGNKNPGTTPTKFKPFHKAAEKSRRSIVFRFSSPELPLTPYFHRYSFDEALKSRPKGYVPNTSKSKPKPNQPVTDKRAPSPSSNSSNTSKSKPSHVTPNHRTTDKRAPSPSSNSSNTSRSKPSHASPNHRITDKRAPSASSNSSNTSKSKPSPVTSNQRRTDKRAPSPSSNSSNTSKSKPSHVTPNQGITGKRAPSSSSTSPVTAEASLAKSFNPRTSTPGNIITLSQNAHTTIMNHKDSISTGPTKKDDSTNSPPKTPVKPKFRPKLSNEGPTPPFPFYEIPYRPVHLTHTYYQPPSFVLKTKPSRQGQAPWLFCTRSLYSDSDNPPTP